MAKRTVSANLEQRDARWRGQIALLFIGLILLQALAFAVVFGVIWGESKNAWLPELLIASVFLLFAGLFVLLFGAAQQRRNRDLVGRAISRDLRDFEMANNRVRALEALAASLGSARNVTSALDLTLDVYQLVLGDLGVPAEEQAGAVFLLDGEGLFTAASRGFADRDLAARLDLRQWIPGPTPAQAELLVSARPNQDPALADLPSLRDRQLVLCLPLGTAHGLYGLVILGLDQPVSLLEEDAALLEAITDLAALAIHNFRVVQDLDVTRVGYLKGEEAERRLVRRALHEGPSRSVAAVALRLGLVRAMMLTDAAQAGQELKNIEALTRESSRELRNMVSMLRPLDLAVNDLGRAVETALRKSSDTLGLELRFGRRATGVQLSEHARAIVLYTIEGTLNWAKKRGQATAAEIDLWQVDGNFHVAIHDNGLGDNTAAGKNVGRARQIDFLLARAKAERVGGQLSIETMPGRGVTTRLTLPLNGQEPGSGR